MGRTYIKGNSDEDRNSAKGYKKKDKHKAQHYIGCRYDSSEKDDLEEIFQEETPTFEKFDQGNEKRNRT